jgi:hypothetical protein
MIVITKSTVVADRVRALRTPRWWRPPILIALSAVALGSIVLMARGQHGAAALGFLCVVMAALALRLHDVAAHPSLDSAYVGIAGERAVTAALAGLDDRYVLVNGLLFSHPRGELDHLLVGPHGLLGIETKAHGGHVACLGGHWRRWIARDDGRLQDLPIGNPSAQLARTLRLLAGLLSSWGVYCPAQGAIVFTHPAVDLEVQDAPFPVLRLDGLLAHVASLPDTVLGPQEVHTMAERLRAYDPPAAAPASAATSPHRRRGAGPNLDRQ